MFNRSLFLDNLRVSIQSIRTNLLRTTLTVFIIAFGIMALVGILTAIDAIEESINSEFSSMGAGTFTIGSDRERVHSMGRRDRRKNFEFISFREAEQFKEQFSIPSSVSISINATGIATVKYQTEKTNPNVAVQGCDEDYLNTAGLEVDKGRGFSKDDIDNNKNYVIIGSEIAQKLFKKASPLDKYVIIGEGRYRIIGVLKSKGSSMGGGDKICLLPYTNVRQYFSRPQMDFTLSVKPLDTKLLQAAIVEAEGVFRQIRGLELADANDFTITTSDSLAKMFIKNLQFVTIAATIIGIITLLGAAVGLMNIMLVQVTERTREIGTRKAIGAKSKTIKQQFLFESVLIGQIGGIIGIILGIIIGNVVSFLVGTNFVVPWVWIFLGVIVCFVVGIASGYIPAVRASKLDPIAALRYE